MNERPLFFDSDGDRLFGVIHIPETEHPRLGFVFCSPFFEEKLWAHRVFVNLARELASRNIAALRFDYMGHGDSEGRFEQASIGTRLANIRDAAACLRESVPVDSVGLLGLRFGATLAALETELAPEDYSHLVLWEPIVKGSAYMQEMLRINLATQMASYKEIRVNRKEMTEAIAAGELVNVDGYGIAEPLFTQASEVDLLDKEARFPGRTLLVNIRRQEGPLSKPMEQLAARYPAMASMVVKENQFWREIKDYVSVSPPLYEATCRWLEGDRT